MTDIKQYFRLPAPDKAIIIKENLNDEEWQAIENAIAGFGCVPDVPPVIEAEWLISVLGASIRYNDATPDYGNWTEEEMEQQKNLLLKLAGHYSCAIQGMETTKQHFSEQPIVAKPAFYGSFWNLYNHLSVKLDRAFEYIWDLFDGNTDCEEYIKFADYVHDKNEQCEISQYESDYYENSIGGGH